MDTPTPAPSPPEPPRRLTLPVLSTLGAATVLGISLLVPPGGLPQLVACHFYRLTNLPCPGCGLTRAFCAIGHGQWQAAWEFNPFGYFFYLATLALLVLPWIWPRLTRPRVWLGRARWLVWSPLVLALAMFAYNFYRWRHLLP